MADARGDHDLTPRWPRSHRRRLPGLVSGKTGAMMLTGHKTRSVFEPYNIVSEGYLDVAARR